MPTDLGSLFNAKLTKNGKKALRLFLSLSKKLRALCIKKPPLAG